MIELITTIGFTLMSAIVDAEHINKGQYFKSHRSRTLLRLTFFVSMGLINWYYFFASWFLFTALFDQILNYFRELPFWYLGTESDWDIFFSKRIKLYVLVKVLALITGLTLFIL